MIRSSTGSQTPSGSQYQYQPSDSGTFITLLLQNINTPSNRFMTHTMLVIPTFGWSVSQFRFPIIRNWNMNVHSDLRAGQTMTRYDAGGWSGATWSDVLAIEQSSFEFPWTDEDFIRSLRQRNCIGMVAECGTPTGQARIDGFMIYELHKTRLHLLNMAVASDRRRQGIGTIMIDKLKGKLSSNRRSRILLEVRETNLDAQLFFRDNDFKAVSVLRGHYQDVPEDAYVMCYSITGRMTAQSSSRRNRIS